jgi:hypothetical protein
MKRMGFSQKTERGGAGTRRVLESCLLRVMVAEHLQTERLVFVDEMGTNTSLSPIGG